MFGFLFAMALPLSFLPIYARSLLASADLGQSAALLMALPIAVEMGCGLLTALLAGRWTDRRGWQWPVLAGLLVAVFGNLFCAQAGSLLARNADIQGVAAGHQACHGGQPYVVEIGP